MTDEKIEVIVADEKPIKLNWTVKEYSGCDCYWLDGTRIAAKDHLKEGYEFISGGWKFIVRKDEDGELYGDSDHTICALEFGKDDRNCWVGAAFVNKRGIANANKNVIVGQ